MAAFSFRFFVWKWCYHPKNIFFWGGGQTQIAIFINWETVCLSTVQSINQTQTAICEIFTEWELLHNKFISERQRKMFFFFFLSTGKLFLSWYVLFILFHFCCWLLFENLTSGCCNKPNCRNVHVFSGARKGKATMWDSNCRVSTDTEKYMHWFFHFKTTLQCM